MNRNWLLRHQRRERLAGVFSGVLAAKVFAGFGSCSRDLHLQSMYDYTSQHMTQSVSICIAH